MPLHSCDGTPTTTTSATLREEGVLILGSGGSDAHNLRKIIGPAGAPAPQWAAEFDTFLSKNSLLNGRYEEVSRYEELEGATRPDNLYPLHAAGDGANAEQIHQSWTNATISYASYRRFQRMSSTRCKECIVYHYWNHMGDHEKSFLNVVIGGYVAVPKKFANNIKGQIPEFVKLEVPDGKSYDIQIAKEHNELVFRSGWAKFDSIMNSSSVTCWCLDTVGAPASEFKSLTKVVVRKFSCVVMNITPSVKGMLVKMLQL